MCLWLGLTNNLPTHLVNYVILVNRGILYWHPETASSNVSFGTDKIRDKEKNSRWKIRQTLIGNTGKKLEESEWHRLQFGKETTNYGNPNNNFLKQMEATQKEKIKIAN